MDRETFYGAMGIETPPPRPTVADEDDDATIAAEARVMPPPPPAPPQQVSLKSAAKPHGIVKSRPSPEKKQKKQKPAQLLAQAKKTTRQPVQTLPLGDNDDEDDDGASSSMAAEAKATSPQQVSLKSAAKPHGIVKSRPSPKKQKPAQAKKMRQSVPRPASPVPVPVSMKRGSKRELEDDGEEDVDEGPVIKRAKV